ncbi:hypothetical protein SAMN05216333_109119 [Nitrosomonas oligotropha]|uniref:Uncharacterized protein n=1 Tax=Nitrosomonas oligotropha TaxID=42354 RepID=A0A1H8PLC7_9PROT|nr:hypothetical protein SAMN05216300_1347 [Nitrosomonas oligotropha]SEO42343.1 hypothetical protein SAMN05216333_109119 [Nitrosomonas oligotropha]
MPDARAIVADKIYDSELKQYRVVATRYSKLKRNFESTVAMACESCGYLYEISTDRSLVLIYEFIQEN